MNEIINKIIEVATGKYAKKFWLVCFTVIVILLFLYPYIDANFFVYNRLEQRIEVLDKLTKLDRDTINDNILLKQEYDSILKEVRNAQDKSILNITNINDSKSDETMKFIAGGLLFWCVGIVAFFTKEKQQLSLVRKIVNKIIVFAFCVALGIFFAYIARVIPTLISVWVNIIAYPILEIVAVYLLINNTDKTN